MQIKGTTIATATTIDTYEKGDRAVGSRAIETTGRRQSVLEGALLIALLLVLALVLSACGTPGTQVQDGSSGSAASTTTPDRTASVDSGTYDFAYTDRDKDASYDEGSAIVVVLGESSARVEGTSDPGSVGVVIEDGMISLTQEGIYVVRGSLDATTLAVDAADDAKVQVVFDGVEIENSAGPAFLVANADKVFVTLAEGSQNELGDGFGRTDLDSGSESADRDATLFSHDDLTINGSGSLTVTSANTDAIVSNDELVICGGSFDVEAANDAIKGRDCVKIADGQFKLVAGDDAITSTNVDEPETRGFVCIDGGTIEIASVGDAVHAETVLRLSAGELNIVECGEGLEAVQIYIIGGDHSITSSDDAVNAAGDVSTDYLLEISGGTLFIDSEGDGLDTNGSIVQSGGEVIVEGPTRQGNGAFDAQTSASITGGSLLATSAGGMEQNYGTASTQPSILFSLGQSYVAASVISLVDASGTELFSHTAGKAFSTLNYSAPELEQGADYVLRINGSDVIGFTLSESVATVSANGSVGASPGSSAAGPGGGAAGIMGGRGGNAGGARGAGSVQ